MEKSTKKEYVAVPTSDVEEAQLPAYEEENPADKTNKRRRRFRFLLIGGAIALLGLTHLCANHMNDEPETFSVMDYQNREPCALRHIEQYGELKQYMNDLQFSLGEPGFPMERPQLMGDDAPPPHHGGPHHGGPHRGPPPHDGPHGGPHHPDGPPPPPHGHHHHHHKDHKHKHHKGHKGHGDEPAPPPPPPPFAEDEIVTGNRWFEENEKPVVTDDLSREITIANDETSLDGHKEKKKPHHCHPHRPFCKVEELEASSTVFTFSPEEFQRAGIFLNGYFSRGGHVRLIKSSDESVSDVKVNVTLYAGREDLAKEVKLSAFDHEGQYAVQIERGHFKGARPPHGLPSDDDDDEDKEKNQLQRPPHRGHDDDEKKKEDCLVYNVDIEFPSNVDYFEDLELHIKSAQRIQGGEGIEGVEFGSVKAGLGHGAIIFDGLRAKKLLLGVINGVVMGTYQPSERFSAGSIHGATKVNIEPTGENINIAATSTFGPASVDVPADSYSGDFALFNLFGETSTIQAPNPEDIHVTKFRHTLKAGYYKEEHTGSRIVVAAKLHGGETLTFK